MVKPRALMMMMVALVAAWVPCGAKQTGTSKPTKLTAAQQQARDYALAEQYFKRGLAAEEKGDVEFRTWVNTIDSSKLDMWRNRRNVAIENYRGALRLNPAHWGAHKRLAWAFNEAGGTVAQDELCMLHMISYMALKPDDPQYPLGKDILDRKVQHFLQAQSDLSQAAANRIYAALIATAEKGQWVHMPEVQGLLTMLAQFSRREVMGGLTTLALLKPGIYTEAVPMGFPEHQSVEGFYHQAVDVVGNLSHYYRIYEWGPFQHDLDRYDVRGHMELATLLAGSFVECYCSLIGQMTEFMNYLDKRHINYDPRLPQMLVGESMAQLRLCFMRGSFGVDRIKEEAARYTQLGGVSTHDLWSSRDYTKELPDVWLDSGTMPEPEKDEKEFKLISGLVPIPVVGNYVNEQPDPAAAGGGGGGASGGGGAAAQQVQRKYPSESHIVSFDIASSEARKCWQIWRNIHLGRASMLLGYGRPDDLLTANFNKVGSGELATWQMGPLAPASRVAEEPQGDRGWLVANN
ncbi:MAG: hypothetical protein HZB16_00560 [Armatimonadetes bacterium]|nr:hypothetical protein [Armatimonadota bacterium]